jgi:hypothetical protein
MQIDESAEQSTNAAFSICESVEPGSKVTVERDSHSQKQSSQICTTDEGTLNDPSEIQFENADSPMHDSFEPGSNLTAQSDSHTAKHESPIVSTDDGMQIDESDVNAHISLSNRDASKPGAKLMIARELQEMKHSRPSLPIELGMQIDSNNRHCRMAQRSTTERREPYSNVTAERKSQLLKQNSHSSSTDDGMQIMSMGSFAYIVLRFICSTERGCPENETKLRGNCHPSESGGWQETFCPSYS